MLDCCARFAEAIKRFAAFAESAGGRVVFCGPCNAFWPQGVAGGVDFAKKLGIVTDGNNIRVKEDMSTNIPGVFSCGDVTGGLLQVCKAVYDGAEAGLSAVKYLKSIQEKGE